MAIKTKKGVVTIPVNMFEALIHCRNELSSVYQQFGGTSTTRLSKGLGADIDWVSLNNWEIDNMDDDDPKPVRKNVSKLDLNDIAGHIVTMTDISRCALQFLTIKEIRGRVEDLFRGSIDYCSDDIVAGNTKFKLLIESAGFDPQDLADELDELFGIYVGKPNDCKDWIEEITIDQFIEVCDIIKSLIKNL